MPRVAQSTVPDGITHVPIVFGALSVLVLCMSLVVHTSRIASLMALAALGLVIVRMAMTLGAVRTAEQDNFAVARIDELTGLQQPTRLLRGGRGAVRRPGRGPADRRDRHRPRRLQGDQRHAWSRRGRRAAAHRVQALREQGRRPWADREDRWRRVRRDVRDRLGRRDRRDRPGDRGDVHRPHLDRRPHRPGRRLDRGRAVPGARPHPGGPPSVRGHRHVRGQGRAHADPPLPPRGRRPHPGPPHPDRRPAHDAVGARPRHALPADARPAHRGDPRRRGARALAAPRLRAALPGRLRAALRAHRDDPDAHANGDRARRGRARAPRAARPARCR